MLGFLFAIGAYSYSMWAIVQTLLWLGCLAAYLPLGAQPLFPTPFTDSPNVHGQSPMMGNALVHNALWLSLFAVQHSVMARPTFKKVFTSVVPRHLERSMYCVAASACVHGLMRNWSPMPAVVWTGPSYFLWTYLAGWALVVSATFALAKGIGHFDLFGLRQGWMGSNYAPIPFQVPFYYHFVRHPLYLGFFLAFWTVPVMTQGRLLFAAMCTGYTLFAIQLEENDLRHYFKGTAYSDWAKRTPMIIPFLGGGGGGDDKEE